MNLLDRLGMSVPIVQAPMAGVSTPELAAAARAMIGDVRRRTSRAYGVNLFVHADPVADPQREAAWLHALAPLFRQYAGEPPTELRPAYPSFTGDGDMFALLLEAAPPVVSFHFGLPSAERVGRLRQAGCLLMASVTDPAEAEAAEARGMDVLIAQGYEAGGHRGVFDPDADDDRLGVFALTRLLVRRSGLPVIAAGGIMDGQGIRAALELGAAAAQLGTAFIACPESAADANYRAALAGPGAAHTVMTRAISGRPARCLQNRFTTWGGETDAIPPDYPVAYHAGKALNASAKAAGEGGFGAQWAGQGAPLSRPLPASELMARLRAEAELPAA